jgi:hypothetical protein
MDILTPLGILGLFLCIAVFHKLQSEKLEARRQRKEELEHMKAEMDFRNPIFEDLLQESRAAALAGDRKAFKKARRKIRMLGRRWQREVTDKLHQ